jgi:hypothetical protein
MFLSNQIDAVALMLTMKMINMQKLSQRQTSPARGQACRCIGSRSAAATAVLLQPLPPLLPLLLVMILPLSFTKKTVNRNQVRGLQVAVSLLTSVNDDHEPAMPSTVGTDSLSQTCTFFNSADYTRLERCQWRSGVKFRDSDASLACVSYSTAYALGLQPTRISAGRSGSIKTQCHRTQRH